MTNNVSIWPTFEDWWIVYDKKVGKPESIKLWGKLKQNEKEEIMLHTPKYVASTPNKKYRKDPVRYIRKRVWEDEIIENIPEQKISHIQRRIIEAQELKNLNYGK